MNVCIISIDVNFSYLFLKYEAVTTDNSATYIQLALIFEGISRYLSKYLINITIDLEI